jgi:hypothetical protein
MLITNFSSINVAAYFVRERSRFMGTTLMHHANPEPGKLFEPDTLMPHQFYATVRQRHLGDPERRLMIAVLEDVLTCLSIDPRRCSSRQRIDFHDAQAWVNAGNDSNWIFSFSSICETLGLDPDYLRRGLNQWLAKSHSRISMSGSTVARSMTRHKQFRLRAAS